MRRNLTHRFLMSIKPPTTGRDEYRDEKAVGLALRVSQSKSSWILEKRVKGGPKRKFTLGSFPALSLENARIEALEISRDCESGIDRIQIAEDERLEKVRTAPLKLTVATVMQTYSDLKLHAHDKEGEALMKSGKEAARLLTATLETLMDMRIESVTLGHLQKQVDHYRTDGKIVAANRARASLRTFFKWATRRGYIETDPSLGLDPSIAEKPRQHTLTLKEVEAIYKATFDLKGLWAAAFRLLLLTGQRKSEIIGLKWSEVNFEERKLMLLDTKSTKAHQVHLNEAALNDLQMLWDTREGARTSSEYVFTTLGHTPLNSTSRAKTRLDAALGDSVRPFRTHDFRRGFASIIRDETRIPADVVDRCLNHTASGTRASLVAAVYDTSDLWDQRVEVMDIWGRIVTGAWRKEKKALEAEKESGANVVSLGR